jgi:paired amphipathic helix protein Sin3a
VHAQVQVLFKDAPELLDEFMAFLPSANAPPVGPGQPAASMIGVPHPPGGSLIAGPTWPENPPLAPVEPPERRGRHPSVSVGSVTMTKNHCLRPAVGYFLSLAEFCLRGADRNGFQTKKPKSQHLAEPSPPVSPRAVPASPPGQGYANGAHAQNGQVYHPVPQHPAPAPLPPMQVPHPGQPRPMPDHVLFFEHVKKLLSVRDAYDDFLRLLNLYTTDVIDTKTLIRRAERFLGDGELLMQFKDIMGWDERMLNANRGPPGSIRLNFDEKFYPRPEPYLPRAEEGQGPSYRRLADSEVYLACSGRKELERSVLNDHWVSHPTWGSEDAGFLAHKKNLFEEALHRCEEERYEFAVHLQGLSRTIAVLEPLNQRIEEMDAEERINFKLRPDLGGPAKAIYLRTLKRIYGSRKGDEIHRALQDCPSAAVPIVLKRLRDKDAEWRGVQRDWSRTWREVDHKNFYKSLDHQGIALKSEKKKTLTIKQFVTDIKDLRDEEAASREYGGRPPWACSSSGPHMTFSFADTDVLRDTVRVVFSYLDHLHGQYSYAERRGLENFLRKFVPCLCALPAADFDLPGSTSRRPSSSRESSVNVDDADGSDRGRGSSPHDAAPEREMWIVEDTSTTPEGVSIQSQPVQHAPLFVNTTFYTLVRLIQVEYFCRIYPY